MEEKKCFEDLAQRILQFGLRRCFYNNWEATMISEVSIEQWSGEGEKSMALAVLAI